MSAFSKLVRNIAPTLAGVGSISPDPTLKAIGFGASIVEADTQRKIQKDLQRFPY